MRKSKRNPGLHTEKAAAELRILGLLAKGPQAMPSVLGYAAFPDYRFNRPQGAAFAVSKILSNMCDARLIGRERRGFSISPLGVQQLEQALSDVATLEVLGDDEYFSPEQAAEHALAWCEANPGWQRTCDVEDKAALYITFAELPASEQRKWNSRGGEPLWREFCRAPCKVPFGFISGKGEFFEDVLAVPRFHNLMMVFKTS